MKVHKGGAELYLIVGLGNPAVEYEKTRHNVGFQVVDLLADRYKISLSRTKFKSVYGETSINGKKIILAKPQTFMNCSGESVAEITRFYKIPTEKVIVIYDDMIIEIGRLRIRPKGSAGGHNGIKNIIAHLSSEEFPRIKIELGLKDGPSCSRKF